MNPLPRRLALVAALAAAGILSTAGNAGAAVAPPVVTGDQLTVSGDGEADTITLGAAAGFITVNGAATTLAADTSAEILVNGGGGNDNVDLTGLGATSYGTATINGEEGNDQLSGGSNKDVLHGGSGDDRVAGFKGSDRLEGGDGNDVLVWNNGDGSDRDEGGAGVDEVEVNGAPADDNFTARPNPDEPGWVLFERTNLVPFEVEVEAERLTVNGLEGADHFAPDPLAPTGLAGLTLLTLNGGNGNDRLVGSDGADQIEGGSGNDDVGGGAGADQVNGGEENDVVEGNDGNDRILGGKGSDSLIAGPGDDTIVWNNGDGSDPVNEGGSGFDRVEVNGSDTGADLTTLTVEGPGAVFQRSSLVPFTLNIARDNELVAFNGNGGDDALAVTQKGSELQVTADGGAGNDELSGADEADSFFGGSGNDTITGGPGRDQLDGGEGEDRLFARDNLGDVVHGGAGSDFAQTDRTTVDTVDGVETLDATPAPVTPPPPLPPPPPKPVDRVASLPTLGRFTVIRSHGRLIARAPVTCPAAEAGGCRTALTLETAKAVRRGATRSALVLGSARVNLAPGQTRTVSLRVGGSAVGLARHGRLAARVRVASSDSAGNSAARSLQVALRIPRG